MTDQKKVPGRAHTEEEKKKILDRIFIAWKKAPEQRLSQFIKNAYLNNKTKKDLFFVEDIELAEMIEESVK